MKKLITRCCFSFFAFAALAQDYEQPNDSILMTDLDEVVVSGFSVADLAKERVTPVSYSKISASEIDDRIGNLELPELLNTTPSIYATRSGGGYGDANIRIRGFGQVNSSILVNGVPVNDMENGKVYWSNWNQLSDIASNIEVQRGLGSSRLAISSVGGTVNIVTKVTDLYEGGFVKTVFGNNGFLKTSSSYSTGRSEKGFAFTGLFGRTSGDGVVLGTQFESFSYFLGAGYSDSEGKHSVQFTVTGAPQNHYQRTDSWYNMVTLGDYKKYGRDYNYNYGQKSGKDYGWRQNFYHKPIASLNWDYNIDDITTLNVVAYASYGRGGGTGDIGRLPGFGFASSSFYRDENGHVDFDKIVAYNSGSSVTWYDGDVEQRSPDANGQYINDNRDDGLTRRASMNSHNWYGAVINLEREITDKLTYSVGLDIRDYVGIHYRRLRDLLGADGFLDNDDINNPNRLLTKTYGSEATDILNVFKSVRDEEKIDYYNDGEVQWLGGFGQLEYVGENLSAFVQASMYNQSFQRVDYFTYLIGDHKSKKVKKKGINIKGGLNYNLSSSSNVFFNGGLYDRPGNFDSIFLDYKNDINPDMKNEKVTSYEVGYGYRSSSLAINAGVFYTKWQDRFIWSDNFEVNGVDASGSIYGLTQMHKGIEIEGMYVYNDYFSLEGMLSLGDYRYAGEASARLYDENRDFISTESFYMKDVKVGDVAQTTANLNLVYRPLDNLKLNLSYSYYDDLYADIMFGDGRDDFVEDFGSGNYNSQGSRSGNGQILQLPSYELFDAGASYSFDLGTDYVVKLRVNVNNLFDTTYVAESKTNYFVTPESDTYLGLDTRNKVFMGWGRTWNAGLTLKF